MNIFVGNLLFEVTEVDVKELFRGFGEVASVAIVMEKKGLKSRGFGFVEMPNDEEAKSAIAALNGKDYMGRVLDVSPSVPKTSAEKEAERKKKRSAKILALSSGQPQASAGGETPAFEKFFPKPGSFKGGRRTRSYVKRQEEAGIITTDFFRKKPKDNPMRWLKRRDQPRPWKKPAGDAKPWEKKATESKPWKRPGVESKPKPWEKSAGEARPWKKPEGEAKPWEKSRSSAKPWEKSRTGPKPWEKSAGESRPWKKPEGEAKPWQKSSERAQPSRFKARAKPGVFKK